MHKFTVMLHIERDAPQKPPLDAPCNGCGLCCLMEPCPLGVVLSRRRFGSCDALRWQADQRVYRCGAITAPMDVLRERLAGPFQVALPLLTWLLKRLARHWIAAGTGCDFDAQSASLAGDETPASGL